MASIADTTQWFGSSLGWGICVLAGIGWNRRVY